jgi:hypothetical protein
MLTSNAARMSFRSGCCRGATGVHARRANLALFGQWPPVRVNLSEPSAPASAEPGASIPNIPRRRVTWRLHQRAVQLYLVRFGHPSVRPARFRRPRFHLTQLKTRRVAKLIRARSGTRAPLFLGRSSALRPTSSRAVGAARLWCTATSCRKSEGLGRKISRKAMERFSSVGDHNPLTFLAYVSPSWGTNGFRAQAAQLRPIALVTTE